MNYSDIRESLVKANEDLEQRFQAGESVVTLVQARAQRIDEVLVMLWEEHIADTGCAGIGLDWTVDLAQARRRVGGRVALQGNLDPATLHARPEKIRARVATLLAAFGTGPGHVFNLGHGIDQHVDPENVAALVEAVHELSAPYHESPDEENTPTS